MVLAAALALGACETAGRVGAGLGITGGGAAEGTPGFVQGFLGGVAAEEPVAASIARDVLSGGGNAADAAVAAGFAMSVTLPSRVGLGGGGACLVLDARRGTVEAVVFPPGARPAAGGDRPAAVPLLARGLFAVHTRLQGGRPFEALVTPAEQLARFGVPVSRALHQDLVAVQRPLFGDPETRAIYAGADGQPIAIGETLRNPGLAATLGQIRAAGVGDFHQGSLARRMEEVSGRAGGGTLTVAELRAALPQVVAAPALPTRGTERVAFLPGDGGAAAAAAFQALVAGQGAAGADQRAREAVARRGALPASAGLVVFDRNGNAASCAFTLNNLFGTGRTVPGMGFLLAAAPDVGRIQPPLLAAAIAYDPARRAFRAAAAGSGQEAAPLAVALPIHAMVLANQAPPAALAAVPEPGRAQLADCARLLPGAESACRTLSDPRGAGVALGATDR